MEAETQTQWEINNQGDTQSTNRTEIIIDLPIPDPPDMSIEPLFQLILCLLRIRRGVKEVSLIKDIFLIKLVN
ncbi:hypothetical protein [Clostridium sp.]|uniref:hypothetical protein n=1 Tax=Clostridium sp. TaxID=1506 RepID=UPI003217279C